MQVKRQKVALYAAIFLWLTLYAIVSLIMQVIPENKTVNMILLIGLFVILIGILAATKYFVKDDMIFFSEKNEKVFKIWSYVALAPIAVLILFDYLLKDQPEVTHIVKIVSSSILMLVSVVGAIYFGIIAFQRSKPPIAEHQEVIDADFEEKKPNLPS